MDCEIDIRQSCYDRALLRLSPCSFQQQASTTSSSRRPIRPTRPTDLIILILTTSLEAQTRHPLQLPILSAQRHHIQPRERPNIGFPRSGIAAVAVVDLPRLTLSHTAAAALLLPDLSAPHEDAVAGLLASSEPRHAVGAVLRCAAEVVGVVLGAVDGDFEVVVEIVLVAAQPAEGASEMHFVAVLLDLRGRRAADDREAGVTTSQMVQGGQVVEVHGAGVACVVPFRVEHGVVDDELGTAFEEVVEGDGLVGLGVDEVVGLRDFDEGEGLAVFGDGVFEAHRFLLLLEEGEAGFEVLGWCCDLVGC